MIITMPPLNCNPCLLGTHTEWCKDLKNFNSVFHIISGLNHGLVQKQKSTWEKVPHKHRKVFEVREIKIMCMYVCMYVRKALQV